MEELILLADLIKVKNEVESKITKIIDRPALIGHAGEYIASKIFDIGLMESASSKGIDGYFNSGYLSGKSVNIKFYTKYEGLLDITPDYLPDYYLVLTGESATVASSRGMAKPWVISHVFLFESTDLVEKLKQRKVKIGTATSVVKKYWSEAEIYPNSNNPNLVISESHRQLLQLFKN